MGCLDYELLSLVLSPSHVRVHPQRHVLPRCLEAQCLEGSRRAVVACFRSSFVGQLVQRGHAAFCIPHQHRSIARARLTPGVPVPASWRQRLPQQRWPM